jgi:predicted DNA-binding transcriptional regulator AlpA
VTRHLLIEDVMATTGASRRTVQGWVDRRICPHRKLPRVRRVFFLEAEVSAWIDSGGTLELDVVETRDGGRVCRPKATA